jgi:6-phosphogluconolactonase
LPIANDGALGKPAHVVRHQGRGTHAKRQTGPHAHSTVFTPDQRFVLVADLGLDQILSYGFDESGGSLVGNGHTSTRPGAGPRHLAFHPHGRILYVANELDNTISVYEYQGAEGRLCERQSLSTVPPDAGGNSVADVHVAPNGTRAYVSNRGHDSIAVFDIDANGTLTFRGTQSCNGQWPRHFAIHPTGQFMVIANQFSGDVTVLPVTESQAGIGEAVAVAAVPFASCVQFAW